MDTKAKVMALIEEGAMSAASAGERYGVHPRTASRWWKQYQERRLTRKPGGGRPCISTPEQDAAIRQPFSTAKILHARANFPGSRETVLRRIKTLANTKTRRAAIKYMKSSREKR
ncbi:hypothetical protein ANN_00022 [Periplaneta americana]|uniref:Insertion element IS150 protein InsJ-like helix-turn-helix domain-containing protein n=1 Tax=Periplaneta americana TaxID=6978 RepID=A0ABQ8TPT7_PERAM|nr:hypothetical protein ANN_00022 [Periplaneta americana]